MAAKKRFSFQDKILFDDFFHRYYQLLCYFAFTYLNNKENAEDIVQSVFTSLWTTNTTFTDEEHAKLFLYKSIKNACINELKRESLKQNVLNNILQQETEIDDEETAMAIIRTEIYEKILRAINDLPPKCGKIFRLAYIESLKNEEIATHLSLSIHTVKAQKMNAKKNIKGKIKGFVSQLTYFPMFRVHQLNICLFVISNRLSSSQIRFGKW